MTNEPMHTEAPLAGDACLCCEPQPPIITYGIDHAPAGSRDFTGLMIVERLAGGVSVRLPTDEEREAILREQAEEVLAMIAPPKMPDLAEINRVLDAMRREGASRAKAVARGDKPRPIRNVAPRRGRNSPCQCGSGRKFKVCCLLRRA